MLRRPHYLALSVVSLFVLVLLSLPSRTSTQLKLAIGGFFLPLFGLAGSTHALNERTTHTLTSRQDLIRKLTALERENEQFKLQSLQWTQAFEENAQLRNALGWQQKNPWNLKLARVILRDPSDWWRTVHIDLGHRDGVTQNMPVLTSEGLVGKVREVAYSRSQVILIGDPNCRVAALVLTGKDQGVDGIIAAGSSSLLDRSIIELTFVSGQPNLQPGQRVVTSGLSGTFPKGIPIGEILDSSSVDFGMYTEARVKLAADMNHLDYVWVLFP